MIIYYDNGTDPLFGEHFLKSGVPFSPIYRGKAAQLADRLTKRWLRPKGRVFHAPVCAPDDDRIIVFDTHARPDYLLWLCRHYSDKRLILWFWNPVPGRSAIELVPRRMEIWSYSPRDCRRYGLRGNTPFYFDDAAAEAAEQRTRNGSVPDGGAGAADGGPRVLFVGREKGRTGALEEIGRRLRESGARTEIHLMRNHERRDRTPGREHLIPYQGLMDRIRETDALLDYSTDPEAGLSLRVMESVFWGKKLVTNNATVRGYDFYDPADIYVLDGEKRTLEEFWAEPYVPVDPGVRDRYLLTRWLERFDEEPE